MGVGLPVSQWFPTKPELANLEAHPKERPQTPCPKPQLGTCQSESAPKVRLEFVYEDPLEGPWVVLSGAMSPST